MNKLLEKLKGIFVDLVNFFPVYFKRYNRLILLAGVIIALLWGGWLFYQDAYKIVQNTYEVFVSVRKVKTQLIDDAILYINEQSTVRGVVPFENPFVK